MEKAKCNKFTKIRCPYCNSRFNYYKIREKIWQCRNCGERFKFDKRKIGHDQTKETKKKIAKKHENELNSQWKGDDANLKNIHAWIRRRKPKPAFCEDCKINPPYDLANISGKYKRDVKDYKWICRKCHMEEDGRMINNLKQFKNEIEEKKED